MSKRKFFCENVSYFIFTFLPMKEKRFRFLSVFANTGVKLTVTGRQGVNFLHWKFSKSHGLRFIGYFDDASDYTETVLVILRKTWISSLKLIWQSFSKCICESDMTLYQWKVTWNYLYSPFELLKMMIFFKLFPCLPQEQLGVFSGARLSYF